jgi:dUTP pyrophosphatase
MEVKIQKMSHFDGPLPIYQTEGASGMDIRCLTEIYIAPHNTLAVPTGLKVKIPENYEIQIRPRSGLALKDGVTVINSPATIDGDFRGEICVLLYNTTNFGKTYPKGTRIAQMVLCPVVKMYLVESDDLGDTDRKDGGFGSTGLN